MRAHVKCHLSDGSERFSLGAGDLIGRSEQAALCLDDPRISEAHALLSLRGDALVLLALRGRFRVQGKVVSEVAMHVGVAVELYKGYWLHCDEVVVPQSLVGVQAPGLERTTLMYTSSLFLSGPEMRRGYAPEADVVFWPLGGTWSCRVGDGAARPFRPGDVLDVGGVVVEAVEVPLRDAATPQTRQSERLPLLLRVDTRSVTIERGGDPKPVAITGIPGKILASVARFERHADWEEVARQVWFEEVCDERSLRRRFDVGMLRLREKLGSWGLPTDLVRMDGSGLVLLALEPDDTVTFA